VGDRTSPPLFDDLGDYHRKVTTSSESVQAYFDQGLRLLFAFNLEEAQKSFEEAVARDPQCAACYWGLGMSVSPHYNLAGLPERTAAGARAVAKGLAVAGDKPAIERDLLEALAKRLSDPAPDTPEGYAALDRAYAEAMEKLAKKYPDDLEVQAYYAESLMNLRPWRLYTLEGDPEPGTLEIVAQLEAVLAKNANHPGANHMMIHALEASKTPEKAVASAERVGKTMPGAAHMVHMPAHIWAQIGRWDLAAQSNRDAIAVDTRYVAKVPAATRGFYGMYYGHNYQFLWWAAVQQGRYAESIENARAVVAGTPLEMLRAFPGYDTMLEYPIWTQIRFAKWSEALAEPAPPEDFVYATAVWRAARGIALARSGRAAEAAVELEAVNAAHAALPEGSIQVLNDAKVLLGIGRDWLAAEVALAEGERQAAIASLRSAFEAEGTLVYSEPSDWYVSVGPYLAEALLADGQADAAAKVLAVELGRYRDTGWALALYGDALEKAGKPAEAKAARERFRSVWAAADTPAPAGGG
jgi:tetratricopeptide (TPR) repeat protein